jgi:hypothetical protein
MASKYPLGLYLASTWSLDLHLAFGRKSYRPRQRFVGKVAVQHLPNLPPSGLHLSVIWPLGLHLVSTWLPHGLRNATWSPSGLYLLASGPPPGLQP